MIFHQLKLIFHLKGIIWQRSVREIPFVYLVLLSVLALSTGWLLLRAEIPVTWKSLSVVATLQLFICTRLKYRSDKKEFLNQYPKLYVVSLFLDTLFTTLPFFLVDFYFGFVAVTVAVLYIIFSAHTNNRIRVKPLVIPSILFPKSAYLWHSQFRVFLPAVWLFIVVISSIAYIHENFNLAIVVFNGGFFVSIIAVILQKEESDFIRIYLNSTHFRRQTTQETLISATIFVLPLTVLLLLLFPLEWGVIIVSFLSILLISVNLLWVKYIFYPSIVLASLFFFVGIAVQSALAISQYGLALIPFYHLGIYHFLRKRTNHYFIENERINHRITE